MSGGDKGGSTTTQVNYSPEEAALRAKVMNEGLNTYQQQRGTMNWDAYNQAIINWNQQMQTPVPDGSVKASVPMPTPGQFVVGGSQSPYPGAKPVAPGAETTQAQNMLTELASSQGQNLVNSSMGALNFGLKDVLYPQSNPALQSTIDTATRKVGEAYTAPGGVLSNIRSNFMQSAPGGQSSREAIAMGLAGKGYLDAVGDVTGKLTSDAYSKGLDTFSRTMAFAPNMYNLMAQPAMTVGAVGAAKDTQAQAEEDFAAAGRSWDINAPWMNLQNFANIVYGGASPGTTSTSVGPGTTGVQRLGAATMGAAMGMQMGGPMGGAAGAALGLLSSYL
jgi:hypothetical protein